MQELSTRTRGPTDIQGALLSVPKIHIPDRTMRIGNGAQGQVFRGKLRTTLVSTAVKVAVKDFSLPDDAIAREKELALLKRLTKLSHLNVVQHLSISSYTHSASGRCFEMVAMELCSGPNLESILQSQVPFPHKRWLCNIINGLIYLHENHIIHRDIKPSNIVLSSANMSTASAKITDFGSSKSLRGDRTEETDQTGHPHGTFDYMSPEMIKLLTQKDQAGSSVGCSTDIWSLGCVACSIYNPTVPLYTPEQQVRRWTGSSLEEGPTKPSEEMAVDEVLHFINCCIVHKPNRRATAEELERMAAKIPLFEGDL